MKTLLRVLAGAVGVAVLWCLVVYPWPTIVTLVGLVLLVAAYLYAVHFRPPGRVSTLAEVSDRRWHSVALGPTTVSGDGSRYALYVRRGTTPHVIIHFSGGGACWDDHSAARPITPLRVARGYTRDLRAFYFASLTRLFPTGLTGLANRRDPSNAFRDWTIVFIPYSTGDLHVGDTVRTYTGRRGAFDVHHNGRNNVTAALAWVFENLPDPGKVLVSGESSGAWASAFYAPVVADHYAGTPVYCLSDGVGIRSTRWPELLDDVWRAETAARLGFEIGTEPYEDALVHRLDDRARDITYLHCNTLFDDTLPRFGAALDRRSTATDAFIDDWAAGTRRSIATLADADLRYRYFLTDWGHHATRHTTAHTITTNSLFTRCTADGVSFADWLRRTVVDDENLSLGAHLLA